MKSRSCGKHALSLPVLGIGCWSFGGGEYWGRQDQKDVDSIVAAALEHGCNYFDTAEVYNEGRSEESLGKALQGKRETAIIGSKISPDHLYPGTLQKHCEESLRRLQTEYIDLYMIHWPVNTVSMKHYSEDEDILDQPPNILEAMELLEDLRIQGKIRFIGVSNFGVSQLDEIESFSVCVNEVCYNLLSRSIELSIMPHCKKMGIGLIGYMPLMQGLLTGKFTSLDEIPWQRTRSRHFSGERKGSRHGGGGYESLVIRTMKELSDFAAEAGIELRHLALAWSLAREAVTCTVNGVRSIEQLVDNISAVDVSLDSDIYTRLNDITSPLMHAMGGNADLYESDEDSRIY